MTPPRSQTPVTRSQTPISRTASGTGVPQEADASARSDRERLDSPGRTTPRSTRSDPPRAYSTPVTPSNIQTELQDARYELTETKRRLRLSESQSKHMVEVAGRYKAQPQKDLEDTRSELNETKRLLQVSESQVQYMAQEQAQALAQHQIVYTQLQGAYQNAGEEVNGLLNSFHMSVTREEQRDGEIEQL